MHQPYYKDDHTNTFLLPWVRLRCAKDYYKMPALLDQYPSIRQTFNLVPSLTEQIQSYVDGPVNDIYMDLSQRPVTDLSAEERVFVARWMTESSQIRRVRQYPRYLELVQKREQFYGRDPSELARIFSDRDLLDLQVWFNLSWIGPEVIESTEELSALVSRGRNFREEDKAPVLAAQMKLVASVLPKYRELAGRGQAELITTPYYHPILPLLADLGSARVARPDITLPSRPFAHPEDAAEQLRLGIEAHQRSFGCKPRGVWPPETALSDEAVSLIGASGLDWAVSDETVLNGSLRAGIHRDGEGLVIRPEGLYRPYRLERSTETVDLVFRDARLSNLIGFDYQNLAAEEAASDLVERLRAIGRRQAGEPMLAVIALDGENCWDFYEANGNHFLGALYRRLSNEKELVTVTVSEFLDQFPARSSLARIQPGSWINGTLDTWVGDPEHNAAWDQLSLARDEVVRAEGGNSEALEQARREVLIAEGSDWFWWFGRSHDSGMDLIWDNLYRLHLRNIYLALGLAPPTALFHSFLTDGQGSAWKRPASMITPRLDGAPKDSEWDAGGYVDVSALFGAMHPPKGAVRRIWFGHDEDNIYLRFDLLQESEPALRIGFSGVEGVSGNGFRPTAVLDAQRHGSGIKLRLTAAGGDSRPSVSWVGHSSGGRSFAFALPFKAIPLAAGEGVHMVAEVFDRDGKPVQQLPPGGSIAVRPARDPGSHATRPLKILLVSAEVSPFAKVGGLADVAGALPKALRALGHDVRVVMPRYGSIDPDKHRLRRVLTALPVPLADQPVPADVYEGRIGSDIPVYLVDNERFFGREGLYGFWDDDARFVYFSRAALELLKPLDFQPDVIHVNDWHSAIIPNLLNRLYSDDPFFAGIATVLTIHNLAFQGSTGYGTLHLAGLDRWGLIKAGAPGLDDVVNLLGRGVHFSDAFNTVSQRYAAEILTPEFGEGMDPLLRRFEGKLRGIRNGIDTEVFDPGRDPALKVQYDLQTIEEKAENKVALQRELELPEDRSMPVIGLISRLYDQKGLDLIANILWGLMRLRLQFVVLGTGEPRYEEMFRALARDNPGRVSTTIGFRPVLAQKIYGGADFFLMPSRFEPCGLGQLISLRYGTIPIVRATGGLADTVEDWDPAAQSGNGFVFTAYDHWDLYAQVVRGLETLRQPALWRRLQKNAMETDVSWKSSARQYVDLYRAAAARHAEARAFAATALRPYSW